MSTSTSFANETPRDTPKESPCTTRLELLIRHRMRVLGRTLRLRSAWHWLNHLGLTEADGFLASYPKSGNTWLKFILSGLLTEADVDFDAVDRLAPTVGQHRGARPILPGGGRLIKTHERYRPSYRRAIYVVRDGRDAVVSWYHHRIMEGSFAGDFDAFFEAYLERRVGGYGLWHEHVNSWLDSERNAEGGICIVRYEDCLKDPMPAVRTIAAYLGIEATEGDLARAVEQNDFRKMQEKEKVSKTLKKFRDIPFVRKGTKGQWRDVFSPAQRERFHALAAPTLERLGYPVE